jgi:hypothetical protein
VKLHRFILPLLFSLCASFLLANPARSVAPAVTSYSYPFVASSSVSAGGAPNGWTAVSNLTGNADDVISTNLLPSGFTFLYNGSTVNSLIVSSNSIICFGVCGTQYSGLSASVPPGPSIQICATDWHSLAVYTKYDTSTTPSTFQIRYEGVPHPSSTPPITGIWEATFHKDSSAFEIGVGVNNLCNAGSATSGLSDGTNYIGYFKSPGSTSDNLQNLGFSIVTGVIVPGSVSLSSSATATYRSTTVLTATVNTSGKVTFYQQNKPIPKCRNLPTYVSGANILATCNWKPSVHGSPTLKAILTPSSAGFTGATSYPVTINSGVRSGQR